MYRIKRTKNIGNIQGDMIVFGGVYGNFQALESLFEVCQKQKIPPSNIICTGDMVAYCAQPEECVQFIKKWGIHCIVGNVEVQLREGADNCGCNFESSSRCDLLSNNWYPFVKSKLSRNSIDWMKTLPDFIQFQFAEIKGLILHGSYRNISEFIFKSTPWKTKFDNFIISQSDLIVAGHCGLPFNHIRDNKTWINAGVIGMPANNANTTVWYAVLKSQDEYYSFIHRELEYDFEKSSSLMLLNKLPKSYALTLKTGIWDNCDILPTEETYNTGKDIQLS